MNKAEVFLRTLIHAGYESYFVGGCVRDKLLGREYNDQDIATIATPEEVGSALFGIASSIDFVGANFGVLICDDVEIAMFRTEEYNQVGKPTVQSARSAEEDAKRRDFTINALFETADGEIIDFVGGEQDIENKLLRAVGNPIERFKEDPSRILRAAYLAASLDFQIGHETAIAMKEMGHALDLVPDELKGKILLKAYKNRAVSGFLQILRELDLMKYYIPEINHLLGVQQNYSLYHMEAWEHTLELIKDLENGNAPLSLVLAGIFHKAGTGLPDIWTIKNGQIHNFGHEVKGMELASNALSRFGIGAKTINEVLFIIRYHGNMITKKNPTQNDIGKKIRKMIPVFVSSRKELEKKIELLFIFKIKEDFCAKPSTVFEKFKKTYQLNKAFELYLKDHIIFRSELPIDGNDLIQAGYKGKEIGEKLEEVLKMNLKDRQEALNFIKK